MKTKFNYLSLVTLLFLAFSFFMISCEKDDDMRGKPDHAGPKSSEMTGSLNVTDKAESTPLSEGGITPYIIPGGDHPGWRGGIRTCVDVANAFETTFDLSSGKFDYDYYEGGWVWIDDEGNSYHEFPFNDALTVYTDGTFVSFEIDGTLEIDGLCYIVGAVIVKGSAEANIYFYEDGSTGDSGLASPINNGGQQSGLSNLTFCFIEVDCDNGECEWKGETAWGGTCFYNEDDKGNWARYLAHVDDRTVDLFAGRDGMLAGTVTTPRQDGDGNVEITITLNDGWRFQDVEENVKIQDYAERPSGNPAPGRFDWKGTADPADRSFSIKVPRNEYYGVHVDVEWEKCPE